MTDFLNSVRSGDWITRDRTRLWALAVLAASVCGLAYLLITSDGLNDRHGRPLGTDFSNIYAGGTFTLEGKPEAAFDTPTQHEREKEIFGPDTPAFGWCYPPFLLFVAAALALMPYLAALAVWQGTTFIFYLATMAALVRSHIRWSANDQPATSSQKDAIDPLWILLAVAFPAVFVNFGHGHNGFLTASLLGGGLVLLDRRPLVAGILFGLLAYKPQFGLMIPLVLIATGRWRTFGAATATVAALVAISTIAFGPKVWTAFLEGTHFTRVVVLERGDTGWHKIQTVFSWVRMWGGTIPLAYAIQGAVTFAIAGALVWLWRSKAAFALKAAALTLAAILSTPYSLDYDMMVLAIAIAFLAVDGMARGFLPWEKTALACLWIVPLVARAFTEHTMIPIGVMTMLAAFALILRRAQADLAAARADAPALVHAN